MRSRASATALPSAVSSSSETASELFCTVSGSFKMAVIAAASAAALPQPSPLASASSRSCPGIVRENVPVDRHAGGPTYRFVRYEDVDLPSLEPFAYCLTDLVFALAVCGRQLDRQIELLAVERADFDGYLLVLRRGFGLAVACHRFNHHAIIWKRLQK